MKNLVKILSVQMLVLLCGCVNSEITDGLVLKRGDLAVKVRCEVSVSKSLAEYETATSEESAVHRLDVFVFDAVSGRLERSASMSALPEDVRFELPVGKKLVYAVVNGPDPGAVRSLGEMMALGEDLSLRSFERDGLVMMGYAECVVSSETECTPEIIVKRLVSRVELRSIKCNVPVQYGGMKVESVFLGDAYAVQALSGTVSSQVNKGGYADESKTQPIGTGEVSGECHEYMYRSPDVDLMVGETSSQPIYMYCQPDSGMTMTSLYILASVGDGRYYYRVPLDKGLFANTTCVVDVVITNLGAPLPPDGVLQKGEITADITIGKWLVGDRYHAEF